MKLSRFELFMKFWLWSVIGSAVVVAGFWMVTDFIHVFQNLNSLSEYTDILLGISVLGNVLGAGLVLWRVVDKYYHPSLNKILRRYGLLSVPVIVAAVLILLVNSPLSYLIIVWSLASSYAALKSMPRAHS
ncbi:MAG TPA: hypothetical protein VMR08_02650 [Patescibacteria group bacterium]|jgi:hypothetical protein|nr:hypothetical protein [Patescibacteria group bacterium]